MSLSITLKEGDKVHIGDDIQVGLWKISGNKIVLFFDAPKSIKILRDKLYQEVKRNATKSQKDNTSSGDEHTHDGSWVSDPRD